jgi:mannose-1-phosphate guanylyltransferase
MTGAEWILCLPADQWVRRASAFARLARRIAQDSEGRDRLITFGMRPRFAHPGYGYIRVGKPLGKLLRRAARFVEKPPLARARRYLRSKRWLWNGGMFLWRAETFLAEVETLLPEVAGAVADLTCGIRRRRRAGLRRWRALKPLSVDHGVLEHSGRVAVAPCEVGWQDLGSWESAASIWPRASDGTRHRGGYVSIDGSDCLVYAPQQTTVNLGVQKTGLVVTQDAILIFDRSRHEQVRRVVDLLHRQPMLARYR